MGLSAYLVKDKADQYRHEVGQEAYLNELNYLDKLPDRFEYDSWDWSDIEWVVQDWKLESFPDQFSNFPENDVSDVRAAVSDAIETDATRKKIQAFTENDQIKGVGVAVATAILLFMEPARYTVLDKRAWRALYDFGHLYEPYPESPSIEDYLLYLGTCRTLAAEYDVSLRHLDRALWVVGGKLS